MHPVWISVIEHFPAWPLVTLILVLVLRSNIADLLSQLSAVLKRIESVGWSWKDHKLEATSSPQIASQEAAPSPSDTENILAGSTATPVAQPIAADIAAERNSILNYGVGVDIVDERVTNITNDLARLQFDLATEETARLLIRQLAVTLVQAFFERTYRLIFGSQIAVLDQLNVNGPQSRAQLQPLFDAAKLEFPTLYVTYTFDQWINFIVKQELAAYAEDTERYSVTNNGRNFLIWLINTKLSKKSFG